MATKKELEAAESLEELRPKLPKDATVTAILRGRTNEGTSYVDFYTFAVSADGRVERFYLSYHIAKALGLRMNAKRDCVTLPFMNMDQAFNIVHTLARKLHGDGYALKSEWL